MIQGYMWPDIVVGVVALLTAIKGYRRGFVSEMAGLIAIGLAFLAPWWYNGAADDQIRAITHLVRPMAHIIGMIMSAVAVYIVIAFAAWLLNKFAKLPLMNVVNALAGAFVGMLKGAIFLWFVLFVALFFPLTPGLRGDLHRAKLVGYLTAPNAVIDSAATLLMPEPLRKPAEPYFARHHV